MEKVKGLPYGVARFEEVRNENFYYVDKTMYLPLLEDTSKYLFLIRPRRFGKSMFVSMMEAYYDIAKADRFNTLFDGLWIQRHPTPLKNSFQVIYFDFSLANKGLGDLQQNFNSYCAIVLDSFIEKYKSYYGDEIYQRTKETIDAAVKLDIINAEAHRLGYPLYLIVDEYDNFTNVILSESGKQMFHDLTHASGFYREYFKTFKAMFSRVFLIGVSPVTLDDLSSGYNIDWSISQDPRFNDMLGFSETDVRAMFQYYKDNGKLSGDIDAMLEEMKPWYNNYCFAEDCMEAPRMFNCDMTYYYLRHQILYHRSPREMVDKNIRTDYKKLKMLADIDGGIAEKRKDDYKKLKMLADIDRGNRRENRMSVIEEIAAMGFIRMKLKTSFPAEYVTDDDNFRSLLYYYGLLTMKSSDFGELKMVIPNNCIREQYWAFMRDYYRQSAEVDFSALREGFRLMARDGNWQSLIKQIAAAYQENSSVRDSILGEHNLQGFFKAYLALSNLYLVEPEIELSYGYSDFLLLPDKVRYPEIAHSYILELKYVKPTATDAEVTAKSDEADAQLEKYSGDKMVRRLCADTQLHLLKIVFRGAEMAVCEEVFLS